ncbi:MAG: nucleotide exchange factor GrpE [Chloroflexota bacterium]
MMVTDDKEHATETAEQAVTPEAAGQANGAAAPEAAETPDLATLTAERDSYLDQLKRSLAEFANYRRRVDQERAQARELATRDLLRALVPIVDDFQRALTAVPDELRHHPWVQGVHLIERKLVALLEREGVTPIDALGKPFDPGLHEAVATEPGSTQNIVVEVYQQGYRHGQHLLRPAMVKVGDKVEEPVSGTERAATDTTTTEQPANDQ